MYIQGTNGGDFRIGTAGNDDIWGLYGNDTLYGYFGNDSVRGGHGNDELYGQWGNDTLIGGSGNDALYGGIGNDSLKGDEGNDSLYGDQGDDILFGGIGNDTLYGGDDNDDLFGGAGVDYLFGGDGRDWLFGGDDNVVDTLFGEDGDDTLIGFGDILAGGDGDDKFYMEGGRNWAYGGDDNDTYYGETSYWSTNAGTLEQEIDVDHFFGGNGNDIAYMGDDFEVVDMGPGADWVLGIGFNDEVDGGSGNDIMSVVRGYFSRVDGGDDDDYIWIENSTLTTAYGGRGEDHLINSGIDYAEPSERVILFGDDGNDILESRISSSVQMGGGAGSDRFVFTTNSTPASDNIQRHWISDFEDADVIDLSNAYMRDGSRVELIDAINWMWDVQLNGTGARLELAGSSIIVSVQAGSSLTLDDFILA